MLHAIGLKNVDEVEAVEAEQGPADVVEGLQEVEGWR